MQKQFESSQVTTAAGGLNRKDAAKYIGCSVRYLDKLVAAGKLKRCRIGAKPVFRRIDLDAFLASCLEEESEG